VTINFSARENDNVDIQALQQQIGALHEQIKLLRADNDKLRADFTANDKLRTEAEQGRKDAEAKSAKAAADFAAFKGQLAADARKARVEALINVGKLEPVKKEETLSFAAALSQVQQPVNFAAADGKTEQISAEERWFRELEGRAPDPRFANFAAPAPAHAVQTAPEAVPADITNKL
jgi:regulator of replication initiation timing